MKPGVQELYDHIVALHCEELSDDQLKAIWPQVKEEWTAVFPESAHLFWGLQQGGHVSDRQALSALHEAATKYVASENKAGDYRAEAEELRTKAATLLAGLGSKLKQ